MKNVYGYARVSTKGQERDGNSLEDQERLLKESGAEVVYKDSFTGTKMNRPKFDELCDILKKNGGTLMVRKLDRFARTTAEALTTIDDLTKSGVTVQILEPSMTFTKDSKDPFVQAMGTMLLAFAQLERDMIVQRTQEGKAVAREKAKAEGKKFVEGRPKVYDTEKLDFALGLLKDHPYTTVCKMTGISKSTLIRYKKQKEEEELVTE